LRSLRGGDRVAKKRKKGRLDLKGKSLQNSAREDSKRARRKKRGRVGGEFTWSGGGGGGEAGSSAKTRKTFGKRGREKNSRAGLSAEKGKGGEKGAARCDDKRTVVGIIKGKNRQVTRKKKKKAPSQKEQNKRPSGKRGKKKKK